MDDFLSTDNIMSGVDASALFGDDSNDETQEESAPVENKEDTDENKETTEINPDELFPEDTKSNTQKEQSESVGSVENNTEEKKDTTSNEDGTSPNNNFYSSIAGALREEGIFPDLSDEELEKVVEPEDFRDLISKQIQAGIDEANKRVYDALNAGVQPSVIKGYEQTLNYLANISDEILSEETERGEQIRRQVLQQDFLNKGIPQDRAVKMTERLFSSGDDIEEARIALQANKEFFSNKYKDLIEEAKAKDEKEKQDLRKQEENLKKSILETEKVFGDFSIDKATRQKIYDNISKPTVKDKQTGRYYTALQQYRNEHEQDFVRNVGILFTLTNGFTDLSKLVQPAAKKEVKSKLRELEHTINNTQRNSGGQLNYVGNNVNETFGNSGFMIDMS